MAKKSVFLAFLGFVCLLGCARSLAVLLSLSGIPETAATIEVTARHNGMERTHSFPPTLRTIGFDLQAGASGAILFTVAAKDKDGCLLAQAQGGIEIADTSLYNLALSLNPISNCDVEKTPPVLSGLVLSRGTLSPAFAKGTTLYQAEVPAWISAINLAPSAAPGLTIKVSGDEVASGTGSKALALSPGMNPLVIEVSAAGQTTRYTVMVLRGSGLSTYIKASNTGANDKFGTAVALSSDTLAVGAPFEASGIVGNEADDSLPGAGAVYVFVWDGTTWQKQAYLKAANPGNGDRFGESVTLSGDTLAIGARFEDSNATIINGAQDNDGSPDSGAVYVFRRTGNTWKQEAYIKAANAVSKDEFGSAVSLKGERLAVGAIRRNGSTGGAYLFKRSGTAWSQEKFFPGGDGTKPGDGFGVGISLDDGRLAVGARRDSSKAALAGAAYLFVPNGSDWVQEAVVTAPNARPAQDPFTPQFGSRVALSGDTLAVSDPFEWGGAKGVGGEQNDTSAKEAGAVYVYTRSGGTWSFSTYLKASNATASMRFGGDLALEGDVLAVGASLESSGGENFSGAAYIFHRLAGRWIQEAYQKSDGVRAFDFFGVSVALSGGRVLVGASEEDSAAKGVGGDRNNESSSNSGAAFFFP